MPAPSPLEPDRSVTSGRVIVIVAVAWPRIIWTAFTSAPAAMRSEAAVWRRAWIVVPASPTNCVVSVQREGTRKLVLVQIAPVGLENRYEPDGAFSIRSRT